MNENLFKQANVKSAMAANQAKKSDLWSVPVANLTIPQRFNTRADTPRYRNHIDTLKCLILSQGWDASKPISVLVNEPVPGEVSLSVMDGASRTTACRELISEGKLDPGFVVTAVTVNNRNMTEAEIERAMTLGLSRSNKSLPMGPNETATIYARLREQGLNPEQIARDDGVSRTYVDDLLVLADAPQELRTMVDLEQVSATTAIKELKKDPEGALAKIKAALDKASGKGKTKVTPKDLKGDPDPDTQDGDTWKPEPTDGKEFGKFARTPEEVYRKIESVGDSEYSDALRWVLGLPSKDRG